MIFVLIPSSLSLYLSLFSFFFFFLFSLKLWDLPLFPMDPGEGSSDETSRNSRAFLLPGDPTSPRTSYLQTPRGSQSSHGNRRPSIRLRRVPSESSAHTISHVAPEIHVNGLEINDANTTNPNQAPNEIRYNDIRYNPYNPEASPIDEEDSWQGRRRSSSEPRPGRWSAPPQVVLQRLQTGDSQMRMFPLTEETSAASLVPSHVPEHLAPPPPAAGEGQDHRSMLRRASMAARSRLSGRNRVSTISGNHGTDQDQGARRNSALYDSRFVDFLDVVGTYNQGSRRLKDIVLTKSRPGGLDAVDPHQRPELSFRSGSRSIHQSYADLYPLAKPDG